MFNALNTRGVVGLLAALLFLVGGGCSTARHTEIGCGGQGRAETSENHVRGSPNETRSDYVSCNSSFVITPDRLASVRYKALSGDNDSAARLVSYYEFVRHDRAEALYWATISAENGNRGGMHTVATFLSEDGKGLESSVRARYWLERAAQEGDIVAKMMLSK